MFDFTITDRQIIVNDSYFNCDSLNQYFALHKLKTDNFSMKDISSLIDSVAYLLDGSEEKSDCLTIENMLEEWFIYEFAFEISWKDIRQKKKRSS